MPNLLLGDKVKTETNKKKNRTKVWLKFWVQIYQEKLEETETVSLSISQLQKLSFFMTLAYAAGTNAGCLNLRFDFFDCIIK